MTTQDTPNQQTQGDAIDLITRVKNLEATIGKQQEVVNFLSLQLRHLFYRFQMAPVDPQQMVATDGRTETGLGAIVSADKTSYL